jgi:hypothetical protein
MTPNLSLNSIVAAQPYPLLFATINDAQAQLTKNIRLLTFSHAHN